MDNSNYNSLTQQLISDGIIPGDINNEENFFSAKLKEENVEEVPKKRINSYDLEFVNNAFKDKNIKGAKKLIYKIFPALYKAHLAKIALTKLLDLNIDAKTLLDKTIPYGEADLRYKDLIEYLKCANEVQNYLKKKD